MSDNRYFGDAGAAALAATMSAEVFLHGMLSVLQFLTTGLLLARCSIGTVGAEALVHAMERCHSLYHCSIGKLTGSFAYKKTNIFPSAILSDVADSKMQQRISDFNAARRLDYNDYCDQNLFGVDITVCM